MQHCRPAAWRQEFLEIVEHFGRGSDAVYREYFAALLGAKCQYFPEHIRLTRSALVEAWTRVQSYLAYVPGFLQQSFEEGKLSPPLLCVMGSNPKAAARTQSVFDANIWFWRKALGVVVTASVAT